MPLFEHDPVNYCHHELNGNYEENINKKFPCIHFRVCVFVCVSSMLTMSKIIAVDYSTSRSITDGFI